MNNQQDFKKKIMIIVGDYTSGSVLIDLGEEQLTMDIDKNRCKPGAAMAAILVGRSLFLLPLVGRVAEKCYICRQLWQNTTT